MMTRNILIVLATYLLMASAEGAFDSVNCRFRDCFQLVEFIANGERT